MDDASGASAGSHRTDPAQSARSASQAKQSSSLGSNSTAFDYLNTAPLSGFNPPAPFQYFKQLNSIGGGKQGKDTPASSAAPATLSTPLNPLQLKIPHKKLHTRHRGTPKAIERSLMSDSDKRQVVQSLTDYVRVFSSTFKGRFLVQDIESLFADPVTIRPEKYDPFFAPRKRLLDCLFEYFKSGRVHPLHWFDVITSWKGGHKRVMTYQEFVVGFQRYCDELSYSTWHERDLEQVYKFLLRSPTHAYIRRQDFRFAMKRNGLSSRKVNWINRQAKMMRKVGSFLRRIRARFADFCPSSVIRSRGKTINVHELESMLMLILTDLVIFLNCPHVDELLSRHSAKLLKSSHGRGPRRSRVHNHGDDGDSQDSADDLSFASHEEASVGSLLSQTSQSLMLGNDDAGAHSPVLADSRRLFKDRSQTMQFTKKSDAKPLFKRAPDSGIRNNGLASSPRDDDDDDDDAPGPPVAQGRSARHLSSVGRSSVRNMPRDQSTRSIGSEEDGDRFVSAPANARRMNSQYSNMHQEGHHYHQHEEVPRDGKGDEEKVQNAKLQGHLSQHLRPEELMYLKSLASAMEGPAAAGGQLRGSHSVPGSRRQSLASSSESPTNRPRNSNLVARHSIIQRYTVIRQSKFLSPQPSATMPTEGATSPVDDDWDDMRLLGGPVRRPSMQMGYFGGTPQATPVGDEVDPEELASFEKNLEDKKLRHQRSFKNVTDHFDRRVNIARARLQQLR